MTALFGRILSTLERCKLPYCALRDGELLAVGQIPCEVDLLVEPERFVQLSTELAKCGFVYVPAWGHKPHHFFVGYDDQANCWLKIDVVTSIAYGKPSHALSTGLARNCLLRRRRVGGVWLPSPEDELVTLVLHCLLDKEGFAASKKVRIRSLLAEPMDDSYVDGLLAHVAPQSLTSAEIRAAATANNWHSLRMRRHHVARAVKGGRRVSISLRQVSDLALRRLHRLWRLARPAMPSVAVVAPDGAGKSTLIDTVTSSFGFNVRSIHMGLYRQGHERSRWQRAPGLGLVANLFTQWTRWLQARRLQARGFLVLFDRYSYDALLPTLVPARGLKRLRRWLLARSCPSPDMVVMLDAPGEVLFARKGEHDAAHLERQRQGYLALRGRLRQFVVVDATAGPEAVSRDVTRVLWQRCADRLSLKSRA